MKGYGLPRDKDVESPDILDCQVFGLKSSAGRILNDYGNMQRPYRNKNKNKARRYWKRRARIENKLIIIQEQELGEI